MGKKSIVFLIAVLCSVLIQAKSQPKQTYQYTLPPTPWEESFGNHRAVLSVPKAASAAHLTFRWRRHDADVDKHRFIFVEGTTGDTVAAVQRIKVDSQTCELYFGPVKAGEYYFYYLPYEVQKDAGFYGGSYLKPEPNDATLAKAKGKHVEVSILRVESRTEHDSFYPMEVACSEEEMQNYVQANSRPFYLFGESRERPVRMRDALPLNWLDYHQGQTLQMEAQPNEYYAFQVALWSPESRLDSISYALTDFKGAVGTIPSKAVTCFNHEGVDPYGKPFIKTLSVEKGAVQPLWFGIDIPDNATADTYSATLTITSSKGDVQNLPLQLKVEGKPLADRGDNDTWRHSRLRWLNSTLGIADTPVCNYDAVTVSGDSTFCTGRTVVTDTGTALPSQLVAGKTPLLASPMRLVVATASGDKTFNAKPVLKENTAGHALKTWRAADNDMDVTCTARTEFDGWTDYKYEITAKRDFEIADVRLEMNFLASSTPLFMGLGLAGQETPVSYSGGWDKMGTLLRPQGAPEPTAKSLEWLHPFDSFWIGGTNAGVQCEFRGANYTGPMLNLYHPAPPTSWYNNGKGLFDIRQTDKGVTRITASSGSRKLKAGEPLPFEFSLLLTPVKKLNPVSQFNDRYYHNGSNPVPTDSDLQVGVRIINVHHANFLNPIINYPFRASDTLRAFVDQWHAKGCKVKIYYTLRELTSAFTELWVARSLGHEILHAGRGGGYTWLREHLVNDYYPQWYHHFRNLTESRGITADAALLTAEGDTRWYNYYVEGLRWLVKNDNIDGLYLDDVSFDRRILQRMRRAMESIKLGCLIDLHSNTGFSHGPANQYMEFFPYVDKIWFGESFQYDRMSPANWLIETSGIPFGLMGDMLQGGGNAWLGMQYGMTVRHPWTTEGVTCDPRAVWKIWNNFDIAHATMTGYWQPQAPVSTDNPAVKVTTYRHSDGRTLLSIGNYSDTACTVHLKFNKLLLGSPKTKWLLTAPEISRFQPAATWKITDGITIDPRRGWLIYLTH